MKKFLMILALILGISSAAQARDTYSRDIKDLPQAARTILSKNFKSKLSLIKIESTLGMIEDYEVVLADGTEVEFDSKGNWYKVETPINKSVPSSMLPQALSGYVSKNHKGTKIVGVEKDRNKYNIELSNGLDLIFDLNGNFVRFDD